MLPCMIIHYIAEENFFCYCLQVFSTEVILKRHIKDSLYKQRIIKPKKGEYLKFKSYERKIKSLFIIYADFENILVLEANGKQNLNIKNIFMQLLLKIL